MKNSAVMNEYLAFKQVLNHLIYPIQFSKEINLKLERISHLLELIGNPQKSYPTIHIGGTSGKGSTASMISRILTEAGYKTGLHTSPNLQIINEKFQINNEITPTHQLVELFEEIKPAIEIVARDNPFGQPSYFEVLITLVFLLFERKKVDVGVIEVGLGGTLDATNVIDSQIAVLTNIGLDHTEVLGDTIELIAQDKAGIIKQGEIVISGLTQDSTRKIVADRCAVKQASLWQLDHHFSLKTNRAETKFSVILPDRSYKDLQLSMLGKFQLRNAACAVAAVHAFNPNIRISCIREGLRRTKIPGRMEIIQENPTVILDGAHNPDKIRAASTTVHQLFPNQKRIVVFGLKSGKDFKEIVPFVTSSAKTIILTTFTTELWNPIPPEILEQEARNLDPSLPIKIEPNPIKAIELALDMAEPDDIVWVTGSLYLVGNIRNYWYPIEGLLDVKEVY